MVLRLIDDRYKSAMKWGVVSLVAYVVPDIYIFADTRTLPKKVIVILCAVILTMLGLAVMTVVRKVRKGREARAKAQASAVARSRA
jgi:predicted membrane-bound spermidine synthase